MLDQITVQKLLQEEFARIRAKNTSFSIRAFSKKLSISPATLSQVMGGKRRISFKLATQIGERLHLTPSEKQRLLVLFNKRLASSQIINAKILHPDILQLRSDQFQALSDWHAFALLSLLETKLKSHEPRYLAKRLGVTLKTLVATLKRLERLGLIRLLPVQATIELTGKSLVTTDEVADSAIRKHHSQILEKCQESLQYDELHVRDFTSMTMAIDPDKLPEAKKQIREFRNQLCAFLESGKKTEVYTPALHTFM